MIAGAARRQDDALGLAQLLRIEVEAAEVGGALGIVEPAAQGVLQRFGLLVDLLEHVVLEDALVGVGGVPVDVLDRRLDADPLRSRIASRPASARTAGCPSR